MPLWKTEMIDAFDLHFEALSLSCLIEVVVEN